MDSLEDRCEMGSKKMQHDDSEEEVDTHRTSSIEQSEAERSCHTPSSSQGGAGASRPRTIDGKPIPFRGLSRNPRLQLALIEAVHSFKPFGYGNVKNGWKKVQEHMNGHKLMDPFEKDGVRHELSWQLCRDVFGRVLDEWKISGPRQTKMDGIDIHDVDRWNELVLEIHRMRQKQESDDNKKRRREEDQEGQDDGEVLRDKQLRLDVPSSSLDSSTGMASHLAPQTALRTPLDVSVFSPRVGWTGGLHKLHGEAGEAGPTPAMVAPRGEDLQRTMVHAGSGLSHNIARARAIEQAASELLLAAQQGKSGSLQPQLHSSLLHSGGGSALSPASSVPAPSSFAAHAGGVGGLQMPLPAHAHASRAASLSGAQAQPPAQHLQTNVLRETFQGRAAPSAPGADSPSRPGPGLGGAGGSVSGAALLERILETMKQQAEEQRSLREVSLRTMQSLESVVKTVASLTCDVADLAREARARRQGQPTWSGGHFQ